MFMQPIKAETEGDLAHALDRNAPTSLEQLNGRGTIVGFQGPGLVF
jgi:hypothetical protein